MLLILYYEVGGGKAINKGVALFFLSKSSN